MLGVDLRDGASATLAGMPDRLRNALSSKALMLAAELQAKIQQKLSGTVLNQRSGALARSIVATVDASSANVSVSIACDWASVRVWSAGILSNTVPAGWASAMSSALAICCAARAGLSCDTHFVTGSAAAMWSNT